MRDEQRTVFVADGSLEKNHSEANQRVTLAAYGFVPFQHSVDPDPICRACAKGRSD